MGRIMTSGAMQFKQGALPAKRKQAQRSHHFTPMHLNRFGDFVCFSQHFRRERIAKNNGGLRPFGMSLLFLAALHESRSLPFSVLLPTPVAMLGAFGGLPLRK
jgi:hypothetical protein